MGSTKKRGKEITKGLIYKENGQEYAKVIKMLGNCRLSCMCQDGRERIAIIRGNMRNRVWITTDDYILVTLRDFQDDKVDVVHKYTHGDVRSLLAVGEIREFEKQQDDPLISTDAFDIINFDDI